jgi:hypothetical protein
MEEDVVRYALVPFRDRLAAVVAFVRARVCESIVVICWGPSSAAFYADVLSDQLLDADFVEDADHSISLNDPIAVAISGKQIAKERSTAIAKYETGETSVLCGSSMFFSRVQLKRRPHWALHIDAPLPWEQERALVAMIAPKTFVLLLDPGESAYADGKGWKALTFEQRRLPRRIPEKIQHAAARSFALSENAQRGYREMITTRRHLSDVLFAALRLPLADVAVGLFAIDNPPRLELSRIPPE